MAKERKKISPTPGFELQATQCLVERHTQSPPGGMDFLPLNLSIDITVLFDYMVNGL